jgi:hypothetical protein
LSQPYTVPQPLQRSSLANPFILFFNMSETPSSIAQAAFDSVLEAVEEREAKYTSSSKNIKRPVSIQKRPRLRSDYDLDARFELALEEFERALHINPHSSLVLCLCARSLMLQARFVDDPDNLQRRANGLFEAATRGKGMEQHQVLQQWGNCVLEYAKRGEKVEWRRTALVVDAIALFERGYETKPDTATFNNPILLHWQKALNVQASANRTFNRRPNK